MSEKEEQFRVINDCYNTYTYIFYEIMRKDSRYRKRDLDEQADKLIKEINKMKKL